MASGRLLQPDEPTLQRGRHRFGAISGAQLLQDVLHVDLHGSFGAPDQSGDLRVVEALGHQLEDFRLARGERDARPVFCQPSGDRSGYAAPSDTVRTAASPARMSGWSSAVRIVVGCGVVMRFLQHR